MDEMSKLLRYKSLEDMITHIAIFKWKKGVKKSEIEKAMKGVRNLKRKILGIVEIRCGESFSKHSKGFSHVVVVTAKSKAALEAYRNHPDHVKVAEKIESMEEDEIGIDFENR